MADRTCALPGCEVVVTGQRKTCSAAHRQAWKRLKARVALDAHAPHPDDAAQVAEAADPIGLAMAIFQQELTPHVQAAITEDTIKAIRSLVTLTPTLVESLGKDLTSNDPVARGRAQALVAKYTLGFIDQAKEDASRPLVINLGNMPTPGDPLPDTTPDLDTVQQCDRCEQHKSLDHYEPGASRCNECQAEIRMAIQEKYA